LTWIHKKYLRIALDRCAAFPTKSIRAIKSRVTPTPVLKDDNLIAGTSRSHVLKIVVTQATGVVVADIAFFAPGSTMTSPQ
jgi:hypothetical protein